MRNIRLTISYDGTAYHGFQSQPGKRTIQGELVRAIRQITGESTTVHGSGRTDAGVHARAQVVNFHSATKLEPDRLCRALNAVLPKDIVVWEANDALPTFHARKSAVRKTYCYIVNGNRYEDPAMRHMELHHPGSLDIPAMRRALKHLEGEHDFTSFCSVKTAAESKVRHLYEARLDVMPVPGMERAPGCGRLYFYFTGNGFLYNMVRIMVGTVLAVGEGKIEPDEILSILAARDRTKAGPTAKAHGLTLWSVDYGERDDG